MNRRELLRGGAAVAAAAVVPAAALGSEDVGNAFLEMSDTPETITVPRMSTEQRGMLYVRGDARTAGSVAYDGVGLQYYDGTNWIRWEEVL